MMFAVATMQAQVVLHVLIQEEASAVVRISREQRYTTFLFNSRDGLVINPLFTMAWLIS